MNEGLKRILGVLLAALMAAEGNIRLRVQWRLT